MLLDNREHLSGIHEVQAPGPPCFLKLMENCILLKLIAIKINFYVAETSHSYYKLCLQSFF